MRFIDWVFGFKDEAVEVSTPAPPQPEEKPAFVVRPAVPAMLRIDISEADIKQAIVDRVRADHGYRSARQIDLDDVCLYHRERFYSFEEQADRFTAVVKVEAMDDRS